MNIKKTEKQTLGIKISIEENEIEVGRAWLYLVYNDLHQEPYGLLEDVFVSETARGQGFGNELLKSAIEEAKKRGCYKLIGTSRKSRENVHSWYKKLGFEDYGLEFRMDLLK
ncbi:MAG: GNAT family N-acetyltransferase [Candidatus Magasanikbacteria bacterium]|nr:GNAT family N-acetyltransferase [Candidatus Magasanikbacteria bacterium]